MAGISGMAGDWGWWQEHKENLTPIGIHTLLQKKKHLHLTESDEDAFTVYYVSTCIWRLSPEAGAVSVVLRKAGDIRSPLWHLRSKAGAISGLPFDTLIITQIAHHGFRCDQRSGFRISGFWYTCFGSRTAFWCTRSISECRKASCRLAASFSASRNVFPIRITLLL